MMGESLRMTIGSEILSVIFCLGLLCTVKSQTTVQFCGNTPADVVFLLDSSNSMWAPHFQQQLEFVSNVTQMFEIGETATQVGLATFNDDVQLQFYLNEYRDKNRLIKAIGLVQQTHGASTATDLALKFLRIRLFHSRYGARPGVPHIAIVITDGQSDNTLKTLIEATKVKRNNINIFTIGVGRAANRREIERMASSPSNEYAFVVDNFSFLSSIKEKLAIRTCKVTVLPTTVEMSIPTSTTTTLSSTLGITTTTTTEATTTLAETTTSTTPTTVTIPTIASTTTTTTTTTLPTSTAASMSTTITTTDSPTTTKPLSTTTNWVDIARKICDKKVVDIVFALDSSDVVTAQDFWYQVKFVRDLTMGLDIGPNKTRIGVIIYSDKVVHVFDVNDHTSLSSAISALYGVDRIQGGTRIDKVIHYVRTKGFRRTVSRQEAAQLLVLVTASATENLHRVKKEANKARSAGVNILTIALRDVNYSIQSLSWSWTSFLWKQQ
uniref:VWFA domain-containing protein n=1 Tax=Arion vulgaris TaxID=1028688 RepID=A0A0B7B2V6_9EUPU